MQAEGCFRVVAKILFEAMLFLTCPGQISPPPTNAQNNFFSLKENFCLKFKPIFRLYI